MLAGMSSAASGRSVASAKDLLAIPEESRFHEVIDGELVRKAMPTLRHGVAQAELTSEIARAYGPRSRGRGPGGWVFAMEVEIELEAHQVYRPDVAGWRRERLPQLPEEVPATVRPDWVGEILSPSNKQNDLFKKLRTYQRCQVPHYWLLDPEVEVLAVYRWTAEGYLLVVTTEGSERVRAEPFDAVELSVRELLAGDAETSA
jgi:Uma2 family endonuclease